VAVMVFIGFAGLAMYAKRPVLAATGLLSTTRYLEESSPEFTIIEEINSVLDRHTDKKALVFIRHTYYLHVPYLNGDPKTSFEVNPDQLQTIYQWREFFRKKNIGFVVRSPSYPPEIAASLSAMETTGDLVPIAQAQVSNLQKNGTEFIHEPIKVVIFEVKY
jgi:hypothetical protein